MSYLKKVKSTIPYLFVVCAFVLVIATGLVVYYRREVGALEQHFGYTSDETQNEQEIYYETNENHFYPLNASSPETVKLNIYNTFPDGETRWIVQFVEFSVTTSNDTYVAEVVYTINDGEEKHLYPTEHYEFGFGLVYFVMGENNIVITARDSLGREARHVVQEVPYNVGGIAAPSSNPDMIRYSLEIGGIGYIANRLNITPHLNQPQTLEQMQQAVTLINGTVVGFVVDGMHTVEVAESTEEQLRVMADTLMTAYPELIAFVDLSWVEVITPCLVENDY